VILQIFFHCADNGHRARCAYQCKWTDPTHGGSGLKKGQETDPESDIEKYRRTVFFPLPQIEAIFDTNILFRPEVSFFDPLWDSRSSKTGYPRVHDPGVVHWGQTAQNARRVADLDKMNQQFPSPTPHPDPMGISPLNDAQLSMLGSSVVNAKPIRKAAGYARISGWMTLMAGVAGVLFSLTSMPGLILGVALAAVGMRELGLARRLDTLDARAPAGLAINQLILGAALIAYAVFKAATYDSADSILAGSLGSDPTIASMPEMAGTIQELGQLEYLFTLGVSGVNRYSS